MTEQAICGAYQELAKDKGYINRLGCGYVGLNTDCEWSAWSTGSDDRSTTVNYSMRKDNSAIANKNGSDAWSYLNTVIERCNNAIDGIRQYGDTTDATMRYYLGEAYFLRSFAYLEMVKIWGDVPARFESMTTTPESVNAGKVDRNVVYDHLRSDLKEAARLMPWSNDPDVPAPCRNKAGRGSKAAALALLARADLMYAGKALRPTTLEDPGSCSVRVNFTDDALRQKVLEEVLWACAQVIRHEDYKLAAEYEQPFRQLCADVTDYNAMEHIWVLPFADGARGQILGFNSPKIGSSDIVKLNGRIPGIGEGAKSNGHLCITPYLFYQFEPGDTRRAVTCVPGVWAYDDKSINGLPSEARVYQKSQNAKNYYVAKYRYEWMNRTSTGDDGIDFPVLRYADVLLMFAEAAIGGNTGVKPVNNTGLDPLEQLNKVRRRAKVADAATLDFETIKTERAKEFCGEYIRKWDLMRWGILKEEVLKSEAFARQIMDFEDTKTVELNGKSITVSAKIWHKYRQDPALNGAWVMDSIYGLYPGESKPATFDKNNGWIEKKNIFGSEEKGWDYSKNNYPFYLDAAQLESRQYWPIFPHYITASNGNLWNNYGY
ncbi:MAG: RagB/SusD family nutrient uptake outer membrane protein [Paludibacteraceae bacterium]|nr:RagB/SusD family nutrient uptake outer membrane protein [Paludibacteraceae bacterium]